TTSGPWPRFAPPPTRRRARRPGSSSDSRGAGRPRGGPPRRRRKGRDRMNSSTPLLALRGVSKRFGAVQALDGVDFEVAPGEVVGLVGDNGAGKSTLVKTISGIYSPDEGEFFFQGEPVSIHGPTDAGGLGIATV